MRRASALSIVLALVLSLFASSVTIAVDPDRPARPTPEALEDLRLDQPITGATASRPSVLDASLRSATGTRQVVVRLSEEPVAVVAAAGADPAGQRQAQSAVTSQQDAFLARFSESVLGRLKVAINAIVLEVDAERLAELAADPAVERISPVVDYERTLADTVPYIGATEVQDAGFNGAGISVAVLDSGIDYTHAAFGGAGTQEAYDAAYGANTDSAENKDQPDWAAISAETNVVNGFDYVGEVWPSGRLAPDPDPIDCGGKTVGDSALECTGGHGTHVADIIGGQLGVAPGVDLHAVKVCSAVSTSCSGVALLLGMDYALDPNADGDTADHVDLINMSLGSVYGQAFDDDLSLAVDNATDLGVLTVASAGNSADKPYVTGTPAGAPSALSVAQTAVPTSVLPLLEVVTPAAIAGQYPAVFQPWSEPLDVDGAIVNAEFQYGDGAGGNLNGCTPFAPGTLTGLVVLVDRGTCDFSGKISNIAAGGADAGIIGLIAPGEPFEGGRGVCPDDLCESIPGFMISQSLSNSLKANDPNPGVTVTLDPEDGLDLAGTMVGSSSRGPTMLTNRIKPEIGAPGASISAVAGSATETESFGGTSGAAPMVTGSAALLMDAFSDDARSPAEIKSLLMNYAETEIYNGAPQPPINSALAAIQRIGAGEVRVNQSLDGQLFAAWDSELLSGALSFGFVDAFEAGTVLTREVTVSNYGAAPEVLSIASSFRFENDATNGAVSVSTPASVTVPAGGTATFDVTLTIDGDALRLWTADSGINGANPAPFNLLEYDGYIELIPTIAEPPLHLAWHVLPRVSGQTTADSYTVVTDETMSGFPSGSVELTNSGVGLTAVDGYSLIGESPVLPTGAEGAGLPTIDLRYAGVQTIPVTFCDSEFLLLLASNTWERQTHANAPAAFEWDIDTDGDGEADYAVYNSDQSILAGANSLSDGRNLVVAENLDSGAASVFFYTDHATNSGNTVLTICGEQIGLTADDIGTPLTADLLAVDIYFMGRVTDVITDMQFAPLGERYFPVINDDGLGAGEVPPGGTATLNVIDFGEAGTNPSELGVLLFTDGTRQVGDTVFKTGSPQELEALAFDVEPGPPPPPPPPPPDPEPEELPYEDIENSKFVNDIVWLHEEGITVGCSSDPPLFCPDGLVTRGQMATFLVRALDLPVASRDYFTDDEDNKHEARINSLFEAGITVGCGGTNFCPNGLVTRGQMATFLVRGYDIPPSAIDFYDDDDGNRHEARINAIAAADITRGCGPDRFCPNGIVTRGQMAAFLHRASTD